MGFNSGFKGLKTVASCIISAVAGDTAAGGRRRWETVTKEVCLLVRVSAGRVRAWPCGKMHGLLRVADCAKAMRI